MVNYVDNGREKVVDELKCENMNYFVEFPLEEDGDSLKRRLSGVGQGELVDVLRAVSLRREGESRKGKKVRACIDVSSAVSFSEGAGALLKNKKTVDKERGRCVLEEVKKWNEREVKMSELSAGVGREY